MWKDAKEGGKLTITSPCPFRVNPQGEPLLRGEGTHIPSLRGQGKGGVSLH